MQIWKWTLQEIGFQQLTMPAGAKLLSVQMQFGKPQLWATVYENAPVEQRNIVTYGTGHSMTHEDVVYVGTYQLLGGSAVFHVFEQV